MRRLPPIDEERDHSVGHNGAWISVAPREHDTVATSSTSGRHVSKLHAPTRSIAGQLFKVLPLGCPCHEPRFFKIIDPEWTRLRGRRLIRIRTDDFQVGSRPERQQCVSGTAPGMLPAGRGSHTQHPLHTFDPNLQIRRCVNEVIDRGDKCRRRNLHLPGHRRAEQCCEQSDQTSNRDHSKESKPSVARRLQRLVRQRPDRPDCACD